MNEQLDRMELELKKQGEKQDLIYMRLVGNEDMKQKGLIDEVHDNTNHRKKQEKRTGFLVGLFSAIGAGLGWLWHQIIEFFTNL